MRNFARLLVSALLAALCLAGAPARSGANSASGLEVGAMMEPAQPAARTGGSSTSGGRLRLGTATLRGDGYVADMDGGATAELTLDPHLQETATAIFEHFHLPYGAAVVVSVPDGRVLAMAGRSEVSPELGAEQLSLQAWAPAASVFKLVSATALVADAGLGADTRICYHGGVSSLGLDNLVDRPAIDRTCASLGYGIGKSQNAILAKLAVEHLEPAALARMGKAFGFGETIAFELPIEPSHLDVPANDSLEFARAAAGFWHSTLSPMHGALVAATIANGGQMPVPRLVERVVGADGATVLWRAQATAPTRSVMSPRVAREIGQMMELTTQMGTARVAFHDRHGHPLLPVAVAGKTGTLSAMTSKGYLGYSWFVGYAPAEHPRIAFAVALGNPATWRIKATYVGRRIVEAYLQTERGGAASAKLLTASRSLSGAPRQSD